MRKLLLILFGFMLALILTVPLAAHHGSAAYDTAKSVTVKGTVTEWFWANPHCLLKFDSKDEKGDITHWATEVSNPADMVQRGWSKQSFKPGDEITATLLQAKSGNPVGRLQKVVLPNGQVLVGMEGTGAFPNGSSKNPDQPK